MSITLNIPPEHARDGLEWLDLIRVTDDDENDLEVDEMRLLHSSDRFDIFSGLISLPTGSQRVVCKIAYTPNAIECAEREFLVYEALKCLQGKVVPRCFGFFEDPEEASCLVLEYAGEPLSICFEQVPEDIKCVRSNSTHTRQLSMLTAHIYACRLKIMDAFVQIHDAGVKHCDVAERNVLVNDNGRVSVIDFEDAIKMRCQRTYRVPAAGDIGPNPKVFGCEELCDLGFTLDIWKPCASSPFHLQSVPLFLIYSLRPIITLDSHSYALWIYNPDQCFQRSRSAVGEQTKPLL